MTCGRRRPDKRVRCDVSARATRRRRGRLRLLLGVVLDLPAAMLPCLLFVAMVLYTAWMYWWI